MNLKTKALCQGCRNDYYNQNRPEGCWSYGQAKVVQLQRVGIWQDPPYDWEPESRLNCYHAEGYAMLIKDDPRIRRTAPEARGPCDFCGESIGTTVKSDRGHFCSRRCLEGFANSYVPPRYRKCLG